jgi:hypothetical protein
MSESPVVNPRTGQRFSAVDVTGATTLAPGVQALVHSAIAPITVKLSPGTDVTLITVVTDADGDAATHHITINGNGHTIDGAATAVITVNNQSLAFTFDDVANEWKSVLFDRKVEDQPPVTYADDLPPGIAGPAGPAGPTGPAGPPGTIGVSLLWSAVDTGGVSTAGNFTGGSRFRVLAAKTLAGVRVGLFYGGGGARTVKVRLATFATAVTWATATAVTHGAAPV